MAINQISIGLSVLLICSCAEQPGKTDTPATAAAVLSDRDQAVGLLSSTYKSIRDTERGTYGLLYELRDGWDSMIYDAQKNYYGDYQK